MAKKVSRIARADEVAVVEAAYRTDGTDAAWIANLAEVACPLLDQGFGISAFMGRFDGSGFRLSEVVSAGGPEGLPSAVQAFTGRADPRQMARVFSSGPCSTVVEASGGFEALAAQPGAQSMFRIGIYDALGILGSDGTPFIMGLSAFLPRVTRLLPGFKARWARIAGHLSAASRVRRSLAATVRRPEAGILSEAEAVMTPTGRVVHAEGAARRATATLARAVLGMARARSRLRVDDPGLAVASWRALVGGRWSLLAHVDSDGRRFLVARKNDPDVPGPAVLTAQERRVLSARARGQSFKLISYNLGMSIPAVAAHLRAGMGKLGLDSDVEVVSLFWRPEGSA